MEFRNATRADLPAIVRMLADDALGRTRERFADPLPQAYVDAFEAVGRQEGNMILVGVEDGAVLACLQITIIPGLSLLGMTRALIEGVRVDSAHRGRGLGTALLRHAIEIARAHGCGMIELTSNRARTEAIRFYEALGFTSSHVGMKLDLQG